jgi:hypothetical protein
MALFLLCRAGGTAGRGWGGAQMPFEFPIRYPLLAPVGYGLIRHGESLGIGRACHMGLCHSYSLLPPEGTIPCFSAFPQRNCGCNGIHIVFQEPQTHLPNEDVERLIGAMAEP